MALYPGGRRAGPEAELPFGAAGRSGSNTCRQGDKLAKPNYQYEKRQKDLAKKKKQEEKRLRKINKTGVQPAETPGQVPAEGDTGPK
jgi:hypothetical protein